MCNVTIRIRPVVAGYFYNSVIGFNGTEYRCRINGQLIRATTLRGLVYKCWILSGVPKHLARKLVSLSGIAGLFNMPCTQLPIM
jgi:hypothetical protein